MHAPTAVLEAHKVRVPVAAVVDRCAAQRDGRPHWVRDGACIFCGRDAPAIYHHVLGSCEAGRADREKVTALGGVQGVLGQLGAVLDILAPEPTWETAAMEMASAIDSRARRWWREQGGFHG